ncbi:hypothetical protein I4U23_021001 [Adineta vaga]|nr:hypothetical protein I4U23_021001 [Adineta vaga]
MLKKWLIVKRNSTKMIGRLRRRICGRRHFFLVNCCTIVCLLFILSVNRLLPIRKSLPHKLPKVNNDNNKRCEKSSNDSSCQPLYTYEDFVRWNRSLCSIRSDKRGPHQKVITLSVYGTASKYTDNPMFTWNTSIIPFLEPLVKEVNELLPEWIIRIYTDFTGSTKAQRDYILSFDNVDVCNVTNLPMFGKSILKYLPGKMWRFLPVFDPFVDYCLSRDLDSPIIRRETETLDLWLSDESEKYIFHILRDHKQHGIPILGGLWGAATVRARRFLFDTFLPVLIPSVAKRYNGSGDQTFLGHFVWEKVKQSALSFDSYFCRQFGGRPYLSQRMNVHCFLGCIRTCCTNTTEENTDLTSSICPKTCRPKDHQDWVMC